MADWIKMRSGLLTNPKVIRMAKLLASNPDFVDWFTRGWSASRDELCDVTRDVTAVTAVVTRVTVGSLLAVWASVNEAASQDGFLKGFALSDIDDMAGVPGFGHAMGAVGWAEEDGEGTYFPNFDEHNSVAKQRPTGGKSAKTGAERTREWRQRKLDTGDENGDVTGDVTVTSPCDTREEKRREDKEDMSRSPELAQAKEVLAHLNAIAGRSYRAVDSTLSPIRARLQSGATVDQCKAVIAAKAGEWKADPKMQKYLRPETLFGATKFEQYLGQLGVAATDAGQPDRFAGAK